MKTKIISNKDLVHGRVSFTYINSLQPSTEYIISIAAYTLSGNVLSSIPLVATTLNRGKYYKYIIAITKIIFSLLFSKT